MAIDANSNGGGLNNNGDAPIYANIPNVSAEQSHGRFLNPTTTGQELTGIPNPKNPIFLKMTNANTRTVSTITYRPGEERRMFRNVIGISFAFTLLFTAFQSMSNLQSSINSEDGLGPYSLATLYAALVISSMFLPTFLIQKFTAKWTLVFAMFGYALYIAAQFYPTFATLIPAAVVLGFCAAPLWSAKCTYLTHVGHQYAGLVEDKAEVVIVRFFGIFFFAFQSSQVWGNLISSAVLSSGEGNGTEGKNISHCGVSFCPSDVKSGDAIEHPDKTKIYLLAGIYLACALAAAAIVSIFIDPLSRYGEGDRGGASKLSGKELFIATFRQMTKPMQILIIPLTIWSGMEQGFFSSDFTQAFISCSWGVEKVGYVMICYGVCDAIASISFGPVIRHLGRIPVFVLGTIINVAVIITMLVWKPDPSVPYVFFIIAGLWGVADAIWQTQINAIYGVLFEKNEEAAFSNYRLWESLGFIIAYVNTNLICVNAKLYSLLGIVSVGMTGYFIVEFMVWKIKKGKQ